jgi:hypothetical protein
VLDAVIRDCDCLVNLQDVFVASRQRIFLVSLDPIVCDQLT